MFQDAVAAPLALSYGPNDHWLTIHDVGLDPVLGWVAHLTIHKPQNDTHLSHDLIYTTSLNAPIQWKFLMRSVPTEVTARWMCSERCFFALTPTRSGNLTVSTAPTALQLARLLVPPSVAVENAKFTGAVAARGTFANGNACGLPIDSGVILSSGPISAALGPNNDNGSLAAGLGEGTANLHQPGDSDLGQLVGGGVTWDAARLEFDVISPSAFTFKLRYFYASEEYPEFIRQYNDPMAIFVSTTQSGGRWVNNLGNDLAVVPGITPAQPVSVSTINGGCSTGVYPPPVNPTNPVYYVDNHDPLYWAQPPHATLASAFYTQYDGMTAVLVVEKQIPANVRHHVTIAVADCPSSSHPDDHTYDSALFLRQVLSDDCQ
jgi:hypothetical protein